MHVLCSLINDGIFTTLPHVHTSPTVANELWHMVITELRLELIEGSCGEIKVATSNRIERFHYHGTSSVNFAWKCGCQLVYHEYNANIMPWLCLEDVLFILPISSQLVLMPWLNGFISADFEKSMLGAIGRQATLTSKVRKHSASCLHPAIVIMLNC